MPFPNTVWSFTRQSIPQNALKQSGVYGLYRPSAWIYVGESADMQARLLEHLNTPTPCLAREKPTGFTYELWQADKRVARQNQLILELKPVCNQKLG